MHVGGRNGAWDWLRVAAVPSLAILTDAGMPYLARLSSLHGVRLNKTAVTNAGPAMLCKQPKLRHLDVAKCAITDAGLQRLASICPQLRSLRLTGTRVTDAAVRRFQQLRPGVQIDHPLFEEDAKRSVGAKR